ncbi:hypothetical protein MPH_06280 [Macrophomina phaseolina MS6]|uniref:Uncharacterized protein n=1 Tax=Macrophomina phaseolina (strain MS6) TaxID=1126212 RepID=K2S200_MACPH|nr:hypothetical protein MPH_06280 [Macrophomina phaseolina MS6]
MTKMAKVQLVPQEHLPSKPRPCPRQPSPVRRLVHCPQQPHLPPLRSPRPCPPLLTLLPPPSSLLLPKKRTVTAGKTLPNLPSPPPPRRLAPRPPALLPPLRPSFHPNPHFRQLLLTPVVLSNQVMFGSCLAHHRDPLNLASHRKPSTCSLPLAPLMSRRRRSRPDRTVDIAKPSLRMPAYASDDKERFSLPQQPQQPILRYDSVSSRSSAPRDYLGLSRAPSNAHSRNSSSPTLLPLQTQSSSIYDDSPPSFPIQRSASFKGSQAPSGYSSERNDIVSPEAPGPTYQNYTASRRFTTNRGPNYESHFSWTQSSQAPPTPHEPMTPAENGRASIVTTASSVARFRTVDSWVGNQAGRIPSTQLRSQPHFSYRQSTSTNGGLGQVDEGMPGWQQDNLANAVPQVPSVPSRYKEEHQQQQQQQTQQQQQQTQPLPQHQRHPTSYSDATVFRQHPGTEVQIPRGSLVPSEVLDAHVIPSAL